MKTPQSHEMIQTNVSRCSSDNKHQRVKEISISTTQHQLKNTSEYNHPNMSLESQTRQMEEAKLVEVQRKEREDKEAGDLLVSNQA